MYIATIRSKNFTNEKLEFGPKIWNQDFFGGGVLVSREELLAVSFFMNFNKVCELSKI